MLCCFKLSGEFGRDGVGKVFVRFDEFRLLTLPEIFFDSSGPDEILNSSIIHFQKNVKLLLYSQVKRARARARRTFRANWRRVAPRDTTRSSRSSASRAPSSRIVTSFFRPEWRLQRV